MAKHLVHNLVEVIPIALISARQSCGGLPNRESWCVCILEKYAVFTDQAEPQRGPRILGLLRVTGQRRWLPVLHSLPEPGSLLCS